MYAVSREEYDRHKSVLFRHYVEPYHATSGLREEEKKNINDKDRLKVQMQFINAYFTRFLKTGGESDDHFDLSRTQFDTFGIPQDLSKRYFAISQLTEVAVPSSLSHIAPWLVRHFQFAVQLSLDFFNDLKFKKLRELRKLQRELPICERKNEILDLIRDNQVMIIAGDTGCGKSTQVPQYLLEAGYSGIACTQPRRIACTALARRVAYETLNTYGSQVAYQIRFETTKSQKTKMLFLTEGLLLRQMEQDSLLNQYNIIILDEVHERHLTSDLLIGLLRDLTQKRSDLKLILMSATINLELFSGYFPEAPVIQVPGRLFPIKLIYRPIKQFISDKEKKNHKIDPQPFVQVLELIDKEVPSTERGDALIFLNGVAELTTVAETLKTYAELTKGWIILLLHSTLSVEEQDKVFDVAPPGVRKCILSTNIAETSVTIDGIRFVVDSGKVNHIKYDSSTGTQKLTEFWVSKASANQRKGRAGRTGPGTCYRLYSEEQFSKLEDFTQSEINRVSLQDMILRMISLNLALDPKTFPFIEKPPEESLNEAVEMLKFQGVVYSTRPNELTALGNTIAKIPVEVPIAKMLVLGCISNQIDVMLTIAAGLSVQSPFTSRSYRELDVVKRRESLTSRLGDPFTLVHVFREWVDQKTGGGSSRRWCHENGIDEHRLYEISKLRQQYRRVLEDAGIIDKPIDTDQQDSRQRRIDAGDRRKLFDMKRQSRNKDKQRKVLKADKHFDDLFDPENEEDDETDPMKADVHTVEFLLGHKHRDVGDILKTHKLRSRDLQVIRAIITAGLYPNFALLDPLNKYKQGQELFVHTRMKPFSQIHPNSAVAQYHSETLDARADSQGESNFHQIVSYGLLLETAKSYVCNVLPIPMLTILLAAKKVVCDDWLTVSVDDFLEIAFSRQQDCMDVIRLVKDIRREMHCGLNRKLRGDEFEHRKLRNYINDFFDIIEKDGLLIRFKRLVEPPRELEDPGFYEPGGKVELEEDESADVVAMDAMNDLDEQMTPSDPMCPPTRDEAEQKEEEAETKPEQKPSYYELLLRRQREKEQLEPAEKRLKTDNEE